MSLSKDDQKILAAFESGKLKRSKNAAAEIKLARTAARNTLRRMKPQEKAPTDISISVSPTDLSKLKKRAKENGLDYPQLIAGLVHAYAAGKLSYPPSSHA